MIPYSVALHLLAAEEAVHIRALRQLAGVVVEEPVLGPQHLLAARAPQGHQYKDMPVGMVAVLRTLPRTQALVEVVQAQ
jgi:hypothetical protein